MTPCTMYKTPLKKTDASSSGGSLVILFLLVVNSMFLLSGLDLGFLHLAFRNFEGLFERLLVTTLKISLIQPARFFDLLVGLFLHGGWRLGGVAGHKGPVNLAV